MAYQMSPWVDSTMPRPTNNPNPSYGPSGWTTSGYNGRMSGYNTQLAQTKMLTDAMRGIFGGFSGQGSSQNPNVGPWNTMGGGQQPQSGQPYWPVQGQTAVYGGNPHDTAKMREAQAAQAGTGGTTIGVNSGITPQGVYSENDMQLARNAIRASAPSAPTSAMRHTGLGVSSTLGNQGDMYAQQQVDRMGAEGQVGQAMLGARMANAQNLLAGQQAAQGANTGIAQQLLNSLGIQQNGQYALANQQVGGQQALMNALLSMFGNLNG